MGDLVEFSTENGTRKGYLALPHSGKGPGVLLMHAWWGLTPFFHDLAERLANEGFVVLAPDLYRGETAATIPDAERLIESIVPAEEIETEVGATEYLLAHPAVQGNRLGAVGFSMGAGYASWLATIRPEIAALVMFYGGSEQEEEFPRRTEAAILGHFADDDPYESEEMVSELENKLRTAGRDVEFYVYPGTKHWFFESNRPEYHESAARVAWMRTVDFLRAKLT